MAHTHDHAHGDGASNRTRIVIAIAIIGAFIVVQVVGGILSGSLALLADAGHMATDAGAVTLALAASYVASRPTSARRTFGWHRAEILAALVNAVVLLAVCAFLVVEGVRRLLDPPEVEAGPMLVFALVGLLANAVSLALLTGRRGGSLNMRGAYLEVLSDLLGSVAVVVAALVVLVGDVQRADPVATLLVAALVVPRAWSLAREAVDVLLEATPRGLDLDEIEQHLPDFVRRQAEEIGHGGRVALVERLDEPQPGFVDDAIHVVPRRRKDGLRGFFWPRHPYGEGEMEAMRERLRAAVAAVTEAG